MTDSVDLVLPMVGLMLAGYLLARLRVFEANGIRGLATFVFLLAIPSTLFRGASAGTVQGAAGFGIVYAYFLGCFVVYAVGLWIGRAAFSGSPAERALLALSGCFSNTVMLGIPLIIGAFGDPAVLPVMLVISVHALLMLPLTTVLIEAGRSDSGGLRKVLFGLARAVFKNPMIIAVALGFAWSLTGRPLPAAIDGVTRLLAGAAPACALFALGASLAGFRIGGDLRETSYIVVAKLVAHPALVWLFARYVFGLEAIEVAVATMLAALPTGANVFILAQRYEVYIARAATAVLVSTVLAVPSAALLLSFFAGLR